ncbi:MAG: hypothetical protein QGF57_03760 [Candidatus Marinimicrobia bacterium]|jgi:hypothetical protein|nr:hypothetical protein [Candidatus Neomarinimicrobiota bacterium]
MLIIYSVDYPFPNVDYLSMISISESITIKADRNKVWAFLSDFSISLQFNRFHTQLELPAEYSISKMKTFTIHHNFGFGMHEMVAEIVNCNPPFMLEIKEFCKEDSKKGFPHTTIFTVEESDKKCSLKCTVLGTYGAKVQDIPFKPILKGVIIEELLKIKNAIESAENSLKPLSPETINPI